MIKRNFDRILLALLLLAALLLGVLPAFAETIPDPNRPVTIIADPKVTLIDQEGEGRLYQVGEWPVLVMKGTPKEMGFQHGRLLSKKIVHMMKEGYMAKAVYGRGYTRDYVMAQSERMEKNFPAAITQELKGMVEGLKSAGIEDLGYEDIRLGVTQAEILHFPPNAPPSCSNFAVWGKWTTDGRLLHGRNLDWSITGGAQQDAAILVWRPKGGTPFMMVGWAGGVGSVSGMNAKGMTLGEMTLPSPDATFDGMPLFLQMRLMLQNTGTIDEAVKFFQDCKRTSGWNFIIGDGNRPDGRALETDAKYCNVFTPMDPKETELTGHWGMEQCVRRTNHPVDIDQLFRLAKAFGDEFKLTVTEKEQIPLLIPMLKTQDSWQRYEWLSRSVEGLAGKIDIEQAIRILSTGPVYDDATLHSFVMDPKNKTAYVANAGDNPPVTATDRPFTKIDLSQWFN
jgi:hypothetical protein